MITCTAVIAFHENSDIHVYHAPSGVVWPDEMAGFMPVPRPGTGRAHAIYAIPGRQHLGTYGASINELENAGFDVCIITRPARLSFITVNGNLDLHLV